MEEKEPQILFIQTNIANRLVTRKDEIAELEKKIAWLRGEVAGLEWALKDIELSQGQ